MVRRYNAGSIILNSFACFVLYLFVGVAAARDYDLCNAALNSEQLGAELNRDGTVTAPRPGSPLDPKRRFDPKKARPLGKVVGRTVVYSKNNSSQVNHYEIAYDAPALHQDGKVIAAGRYTVNAWVDASNRISAVQRLFAPKQRNGYLANYSNKTPDVLGEVPYASNKLILFTYPGDGETCLPNKVGLQRISRSNADPSVNEISPLLLPSFDLQSCHRLSAFLSKFPEAQYCERLTSKQARSKADWDSYLSRGKYEVDDFINVPIIVKDPSGTPVARASTEAEMRKIVDTCLRPPAQPIPESRNTFDFANGTLQIPPTAMASIWFSYVGKCEDSANSWRVDSVKAADRLMLRTR
jgi:hypothetical protein